MKDKGIRKSIMEGRGKTIESSDAKIQNRQVTLVFSVSQQRNKVRGDKCKPDKRIFQNYF